MTHTALLNHTRLKQNPVLIIDKKGFIGQALSERISKEELVVLISSKPPKNLNNIIHISFSKNLPDLPDNIYSYVIIIDEDLSLSQKYLDKIIKKTKKDRTGLFIGVNKNYLDDKFYLKFISPNSNIKFGILGDVFSDTEILNDNNIANEILHEVKIHGRIQLPGDGTKEIFPVLIRDVVSAIVEICFSDHNEKVYYILPKNKITYLSFALAIKKSHPDVKLDFKKEKLKLVKPNTPLTGRYVFGENYDIGEKLKTTNIENYNHDFNPTKVHNNTGRNSIFLTSIFLISLILLPLFSTVVLSRVNRALIVYSEKELNSGKINKAKILLNTFVYTSFLSKSSQEIFYEQIKILQLQQQARSLYLFDNNDINLGNIYIGTTLYLESLNNILKGQTSNPQQEFTDAIINLKKAIISLSLNQDMSKNNEVYNKVANVLYTSSSLVGIMPDLFAIGNKRKYLFIQTDKIVSSTQSGVIKGYALLGIENGKLTNIDFKTGSPSSSIASILKTVNTNINGVIFANDKVLSLLRENSKSENLISIGLFKVVVDSLKSKQMFVLLSNPLEQKVIQANNFSQALNK